MKALTPDQIDGIVQWLDTWEVIELSSIPHRFIETFSPDSRKPPPKSVWEDMCGAKGCTGVDGISDKHLLSAGWLEINKILPEKDQWCFFWVGLSKPMIGNYKGDGKFLCPEDNDFWIISEDYISHWMPCPSPPAS